MDGGWKNCGLASEIIASVTENIPPGLLKNPPKRICLPDCPAPTSRKLEEEYYPSEEKISKKIKEMLK